MRTLCLGEALVNLVREEAAPAGPGGSRRTRCFGGATANVAVHAARLGARVALAGGAGDDPWGRWLSGRLAEEGVEVDAFRLLEGTPTAVALVTVAPSGEPSYAIHGEALGAAIAGREEELEELVSGAGALFCGSNTLAGPAEREVTMRARARALAEGKPVILDANLRLHRWSSVADAAATVNACVPEALLVRANREEAEVLTGEPDPERAATALLKAGARLAVVTLGAGGAILRGARRADAPGRRVRVRSTIGAGDALTGTLLGRLALAGWYPSAAAAALPEAVEASARACARLGAI